MISFQTFFVRAFRIVGDSQLSQINPPPPKKTAEPNAKEIFGMEHSRIRWHYKYKERHKSFINMWIYRKN